MKYHYFGPRLAYLMKTETVVQSFRTLDVYPLLVILAISSSGLKHAILVCDRLEIPLLGGEFDWGGIPATK